MALRSQMWSSRTLERGLGLAHQATLSLEADPEMIAMKQELLDTWPNHIVRCRSQQFLILHIWDLSGCIC